MYIWIIALLYGIISIYNGIISYKKIINPLYIRIISRWIVEVETGKINLPAGKK